MVELRPKQRETVDNGKAILKRYNLLYLACQPRTGKSLMSMTICKEIGYRRVCFLSIKKAIKSIENDYHINLGHKFDRMVITNYQQVPNIDNAFDVYILDESTFLSAFPKPGAFCKLVKKLVGKKPVILMSGTPTPESFSQIFHQFWVSYYSPFSVYKNFYEWARDGFVNIKQKYVNGGFPINDYSKANEEKINEITKHYMLFLSQKESGFSSDVDEQILWVDIDPRIYKLMSILKRDKVYKLKSGHTILADQAAHLQSVFHQLSSGTVITDDGKRHVLDESKVKFIKQYFAGKKIAIFYQFIAEGELLRKWFPLNTDSPEVFNQNSNVIFICQSISGRMGVNLSTADAQVMYNIGFSATTYFQIRERQQTHGKTQASKMYWIFSKLGIEKNVYKAVTNKKPYTLNYFKKEYSVK